MAAQTLERRLVGQTGLEVTTLGLGGASLAGNYTPVPANLATVPGANSPTTPIADDIGDQSREFADRDIGSRCRFLRNHERADREYG